MWRALDFKDYILKKEKTDDGWNICISDFVDIWSRTLKNEEMIAIFKETNPLIEAKFNDKLIIKILSLFDGFQAVYKKIEKIENHLLIELESDFSGVKFFFKLELKKLEADKIFKDITLPFMLLAANLQIRENKLLDIIKKKDAEISEYKEENAIIKRSHLITKKFSFDEVLKEGLEETYSSLSKIRKNPSLIWNVINADALQASVCSSLQGTEVAKKDVELKNPQHIGNDTDLKRRFKNMSSCKRSLRSNTKNITKAKSKVEVKINSCSKNRKGNYLAQLKL